MDLKINRAFSFIEIFVVISAIIFIFGVVFVILVDARLDSRDKKRIEDVGKLQKALVLYEKDNGSFPKESEGTNGDTAGNKIFRELLLPYLNEVPVDPAGFSDDTFYYYYDGSHACGEKNFAVIIARQMDRIKNSNYDEFLNTTCGGILDDEGSGGGTESYNVIVGPSSD